MKSDLDNLMAERELDAFIIAGGEGYSVVRDYLSNGADITGGYIIKKHGADPILVVNGMEIEEAQKSGLTAYTYNELDYMKLIQESEDMEKAQLVFWSKMLEKADVATGRVGIYGRGDINVYIEMIESLREALPQYEFVGEKGTTLFDEAFITKDADEIQRIKSVAQRTVQVLEATWDFVAVHKLVDGTVTNSEGHPLTIGAVKRFVRRELLDRDLEDTGMIFAQGRDAGYPHSRGEADMVLQAGQSIVFDLFPREIGGGYHHDTTRTWCIGYAPPEVQQAYDAVIEGINIAEELFVVGKPTHLMQEAVQDYLESLGHPTGRSEPGTMVGYMHSLGHGVGLNIHERPSISHMRKNDTFQVGNCLTIEPGLYYPDDGYGVRVEDLYIVSEAGELISLTDFRRDLVIPMEFS